MLPFHPSKRVIFAVSVCVLCIGIFVMLSILRNTMPVQETIVPSLAETQSVGPKKSIIGNSVLGREIEAHSYGTGKTHLLFVGGMHGGYEWNSVLLSYQFIDYLDKNINEIPVGLTVTVIPSINPDGVFKVTGKNGRFTASDVSTKESDTIPGRFNAHEVDLNRNFDCKWKPKSTWRGDVVSAGTSAFSEPEAQALRDFVLTNKVSVGVFWHSQSNAVYASECESGILPETLDIMNAYSKASGYGPVKSFDAYEVTGDAEGWFASINIPAVTVELKTHESVEWDRNLAGIKAIFEYYGKKPVS